MIIFPLNSQEGIEPEVMIISSGSDARKAVQYYLDPFELDASGFLYARIESDINTIRQAAELFIVNTVHGIPESIKYFVCSDATVYRALTGMPASADLGYVREVLPAFRMEGVHAIYVPHFEHVFHNPKDIKQKISLGITALISHKIGVYADPGSGLQKKVINFPNSLAAMQGFFYSLETDPTDFPIYVDIETFSLKFYEAGLGSISFGSNGNAHSFPIDDLRTKKKNKQARSVLKEFFIKNWRKLIFHNISFDATVLIYQLFMEDLLDHKGLHEGLNALLKNWDDTRVIAYLALNSCTRPDLSLKALAQPFAGNYAIDEIKDITKVPLEELLTYNGIDVLSTEYVYNTYYPQMVKDNQEELYKTLFKDAVRDIIQMQLTGMPLNMDRVLEVNALMEADRDTALAAINSSPLVQEAELLIKEDWVVKGNAKLKKKRVTIEDCPHTFNVGSDRHLQFLLYEVMELPIIEKTQSGAASTDGKTLKALKNHTTLEPEKQLLDAIGDFKLVDKVLTTFLPAFMEAPKAANGWHYLYGSFNIGGTVSGRLSSSNINLQQLPAQGKLGKLVKSCFQAPPGWLFIGLDFASLEDRISALTTKDPNKLKVYLEDFDGHSLRAAAYYKDQMPDIDPTDNISVNSIAEKYPKLRQESKTPTFALTYGGTWKTMVRNAGFSEEKAKAIEASYHELYKVSDAWVQGKLNKASSDGYVTVAFGLRVRTPKLAQVVRGNRRTPHEAEAEGRTAGNALGQSWGLLNNRAASAFLSLVREHGLQEGIRLCAQIHDAQYYVIPDNIDTLMFVNEHLVREVNWNDHPDIYHPQVGLGGELSVFHPSWAEEYVIPNGASEDDILNIFKD